MTDLVTVVTGAGSGIGAAIARELSGRGHHVVVTDKDADRAARVAGEFGAEHRILDVTDAEAAAGLCDDVVAQHGRIDVWVNNAGVSSMAAFVDVPREQLEDTFAVNVYGVFLCSQAAARAMIATGGGGRIINIASMAGKQGRAAFLSDYVASKFAVVGLTQAMAGELAVHGITVNSVCPGFVATPMQEREAVWEAELRGITPEQVLQDYIDATPLGRLQTPEDVARGVAFLASDDAGFITGEALSVNGGALMD